VRGPFPIWLRNWQLAEHGNQFGIALREHSTIGRRIFELAVITVCRAWTVQYAWASHSAQAAAAGIDPNIIAAIRDRRRPDFKDDKDRVAYDVASEIMQTTELSQATYDHAIRTFGLQGTVELVSTIGYYAMVGIFLKSFGVQPPDGSTPLK
jgi:4-carboxymuconolactone decarboxylase